MNPFGKNEPRRKMLIFLKKFGVASDGHPVRGLALTEPYILAGRDIFVFAFCTSKIPQIESDD